MLTMGKFGGKSQNNERETGSERGYTSRRGREMSGLPNRSERKNRGWSTEKLRRGSRMDGDGDGDAEPDE